MKCSNFFECSKINKILKKNRIANSKSLLQRRNFILQNIGGSSCERNFSSEKFEFLLKMFLEMFELLQFCEKEVSSLFHLSCKIVFEKSTVKAVVLRFKMRSSELLYNFLLRSCQQFKLSTIFHRYWFSYALHCNLIFFIDKITAIKWNRCLNRVLKYLLN